MSSLLVKPVNSRGDQKRFIRYPWELYAGDPNWVPPLLMEHKRLLNYRPHPFYEAAEIQTFLAFRQGAVCGRIAAIVNHAHNQKYNERRGFFGFFESVDDQEVADSLFSAARGWLFERGMTHIRGPANPSMNYECGLLVEGFHSPPTFMMTYNKPYYDKLVTAFGFQKAQNLFAFWGHIEMVAQLDQKLWFIVQEAKERFTVKTRAMRKDRFTEELEMFLSVYNASAEGMWGFVPLSNNEIKALGAGLKHLIVPEIAVVAEIDGQAIGACFGLLDYNPRIKRIDGRLFPFGFVRLLRRRHDIKKMRVISINVVPEYQRWGLGVVLLSALIEPVRAFGVREVEFSWVTESNTLSRGSLEKGGAKLDKTYRMYDYEPAV